MVYSLTVNCSLLENLLRVTREAAKLGVFVSYTIAWGDPSSINRRVIDEEFEKAIEYTLASYEINELKNNPVAKAYRSFYWRIGIDPTKTRPAGEALARRVLRRGVIPKINPIVDAGNIASMKTLVPIGVYDLDKATPPLRIKLSVGGEEFKPIGGEPIKLDAGLPILVDSKGIVMHLYPHRDSVETMVTNETSRVLIVAAGAPGVPDELVDKAAVEVARILEKAGWSWCGFTVKSP